MARMKSDGTEDKRKRLAPTVSSDIPKGYTEVASAQVPLQDWEKNPVLEGEVISIKNITYKKKETQIMSVRNVDGHMRAFWRSKALEDLFSVVKPGMHIFVKYEGRKKIKGGQSFLEFRAGWKK